MFFSIRNLPLCKPRSLTNKLNKTNFIFLLGLSATSSTPLGLCNRTHTCRLNALNIYIRSEIQHTQKHSYIQPFRPRYSVLNSNTHALTLVDVASDRLLPPSPVHGKSTRRATLNAALMTNINSVMLLCSPGGNETRSPG